MRLESFKEIDHLKIFRNGLFAGMLQRTEDGSSFSYDPEFLSVKEFNPSGIALCMPPSKMNYRTTGDNLPPFFAGLLPEGLRLSALLDSLKTSASDMFSLLAASGTESIGDVHAIPERFEKSKPAVVKKPFNQISFAELFSESIGATDYSARLLDPSISGIHPKISSAMISFPVGVANRNRLYLLKLGPEKYPQLVENEFFFMQMASACGLETAPVKLIHDRDQVPGLLVQRFDRRYNRARKGIERLHVEDACQFLNRYPHDKYRLTISEIANALTQHCSSPILEIGKLLKLLAFSYLIGNGDLHAKNISLISEPGAQSRIKFAPAYDLVSTLPYGDQRMALKLDGKDDNLSAEIFLDFAARYDLPAKAMTRLLRELSTAATPWIPRVEQIGFSDRKTRFLQETIKTRLEQLSP